MRRAERDELDESVFEVAAAGVPRVVEPGSGIVGRRVVERREATLCAVKLSVSDGGVVRGIACETRARQGSFASSGRLRVARCGSIEIEGLVGVAVPALDAPHAFDEPRRGAVEGRGPGPRPLAEGVRFDRLRQRQGLRSRWKLAFALAESPRPRKFVGRSLAAATATAAAVDVARGPWPAACDGQQRPDHEPRRPPGPQRQCNRRRQSESA